MENWQKVKIKVLDKYLASNLIQEYVKEDQKAGFDLCDIVNVGDEFVLDEPNMPEGFCPWAWADINRDVISMMSGGSFPWIEKEGVAIASCTDGLRPVMFLIQRIED